MKEWIEIGTPGNVLLNDLIFTDSSTGYAVGSDGTILKYHSAISNTEELLKRKLPEGFSLRQNHPNPFNPVTTINYYIPEPCFVTIKIYDILSNEIYTLVEDEKPAGNYETTWYPVNIPSGIYFYRIKAGKFIETKKMLLVK